MNQLPIGMFQPGDSVIYRLNSVVKILIVIILLASVILTDNIPGYCILVMFFGMVLFISKINISTVLAFVVRLKWFFLLILILNTCFFSAEDAWIKIWIFQPSYEGLMQGLHVVFSVIFALAISNLLTVTTTPLSLTDAISILISPLRILRVPTGQISMIMSVAIQFIPALLEESDMIRRAQTARGAKLDSRRLTEKAKAGMALIIPVFIAAFRRADELSMAMEARGYRADIYCRQCRIPKLSLKDVMALVICTGLCVLQILI